MKKPTVRPGFMGMGYHEEVDADEFLEALDPSLMGIPEGRRLVPSREEKALLDEHRHRLKSLAEEKMKGDRLVDALDFFRRYVTTNIDFDRSSMEITVHGDDKDGQDQALVLRIVDWSGPEYVYGLDLTALTSEERPESVDVAVKAWNAMKLPIKPVVAKHRSYVWARKGLEVVCANNPFDAKDRPGYCSYMGLRGNKKDVQNAVRVIKQTAKQHGGDVKDTSPGTLDFIGFPDA